MGDALASLRAAVEAMTPGPWRACIDSIHVWHGECECVAERVSPADAAGIVALVNVARELIAVAETTTAYLNKRTGRGPVDSALAALRAALAVQAENHS